MEQQVTVMQWYVVTGTAGATVSTPEGVTLCTIPDGGQGAFYAITSTIVTSDDSVSVVKATFKYAPAKLKALGLIGGGESALPAGYLAAEFLESTGTQYINLKKIPDDSTGGKITGCYVSMSVPYGEPSLLGSYGSANVRFWVSMLSAVNQNGERTMVVGWNGTSSVGDVVTEGDIVESELNYKNSRKYAMAKNGVVYEKMLSGSLKATDSPLMFFAQKKGTALFCLTVGRIYNAAISQGTAIESNFIPALDPTGVPCMFDKVSKQPFYNDGTGAFIVGMTLAQARKLGKLPAGGGTLTVSLPSNYLEDEGVVNAIAEANAKGWNIEVASTWDASGASATFALRRIWVRKTRAEQGNYVAADGTRWAVESCVAMYNADGSEPDAHGYEPFRSVDAAVAYWELVPYVNPEEELLTETTTNEYE